MQENHPFMNRQTNNLGATALPRRRRKTDPMRDFDRLPPELRAWVAGAALPWSPKSCLRLWHRACAAGASPTEALARLDDTESRMLARDGHTIRA